MSLRKGNTLISTLKLKESGADFSIPKVIDSDGKLINATLTSFTLPSNITDLGLGALVAAFYFNRNLSGLVNLDSLTQVSGMFALGNAFGYTNISSVSMKNLVAISGDQSLAGTFFSDTNLVSVSFPSLSILTGAKALDGCFRNCSSLTSVSFPALTASSFGSTTNQFSDMLSRCSNVTVHFPAAIEATISSWSDVTAGFGGTNTTVLFDL